jgi:hypothetical protein
MAKYSGPDVERENEQFAEMGNMYATKPGFALGKEQRMPTGSAAPSKTFKPAGFKDMPEPKKIPVMSPRRK